MPDSFPSTVRSGLFRYEIDLALMGPVAVGREVVTVRCKFRHFNDTPIRLQPGVSGEFNLGFRIYENDLQTLIFEDRMVPPTGAIDAERWLENHDSQG